MTITAIIISKDGQVRKTILDSLKFCNEIVLIIDGKGENNTAGKLKKIYYSLGGDYSSKRNFGLNHVSSDWVIFVDDDEYVGQELQREIVEAIQNPTIMGYYLNRVDLVFGQAIKHGEAGHTSLIRLGRKNAGYFFRPVHEYWKIFGKTSALTSPLYHLKDNFISDFLKKMSHYGQIDSQALSQEGKPYSLTRLLLYPPSKFILNYFIRAGLLDGTIGLFYAYLMSIQSLTIRIFQWEKETV